LKRAEKPHLKFSGRKALDGPATRPKTPLAVENGVGKLTAPEKGAPNVTSARYGVGLGPSRPLPTC
jgi:hypothetical protein